MRENPQPAHRPTAATFTRALRAAVVLAVLAASACGGEDAVDPLSPSFVSPAPTAPDATVYVLRGTVSEKDGGPIEGARVAAGATDPSDRDSSSTDITDGTGFYALSGLNRTVTLTIEAPGYEPAQIATIDVATSPVANFVLTRTLAASTY